MTNVGVYELMADVICLCHGLGWVGLGGGTIGCVCCQEHGKLAVMCSWYTVNSSNMDLVYAWSMMAEACSNHDIILTLHIDMATYTTHLKVDMSKGTLACTS